MSRYQRWTLALALAALIALLLLFGTGCSSPTEGGGSVHALTVSTGEVVSLAHHPDCVVDPAIVTARIDAAIARHEARRIGKLAVTITRPGLLLCDYTAQPACGPAQQAAVGIYIRHAGELGEAVVVCDYTLGDGQRVTWDTPGLIDHEAEHHLCAIGARGACGH